MIFSNEDFFITNNSGSIYMLNGEISPTLGDYVSPSTTAVQIAYAFVSY